MGKEELQNGLEEAEAALEQEKNKADINEMEIALDHANKAHNEGKKAMKRTHMQLGDVNAAIEEERKIKNEVLEAYGLTERKVNAMNGELENDIHQMQADLDNMLASCKNSEEKAKKAMVDAGRLADELRAEQDHAAAQDKAARTTEVS